MKFSKRSITIENQKKLEGLMFIAPWTIGFMIFMAYPIFFSLYISFFKVKITKGLAMTFYGIENYRYALTKETTFIDAMATNFKETIGMIPIIVVFAFLVANLLNNKFRGRGLFRGLFFLPVIMSTGLLIDQLNKQGLGSMSFMANNEAVSVFLMQNLGKSWALPLINLMNKFVIILWYSGVQTVIFIAGLQSISKSVYDAAKIDGASAWESFWKITLPASTPFILLNIIYTLVDLFTVSWNPIITYINNSLYSPTTGLGYGAALGWMYFVMIAVVMVPVFLILNRRSNNVKIFKK